MAAEPDYYRWLGIDPSASADEVKAVYRRLAMKFHPDLSHSATAADAIRRINQAYEVLGDADRRAVYDADRKLREALRRPQPAAPKPTPPASSHDTSPVRPTGRPATGGSRHEEEIVRRARLAFVNRDYPQAARLAREALRDSPRNAVALEVLADVAARRGDRAQAQTLYAHAIQLNPANRGLQRKYEVLLGVTPAAPGPMYSATAGYRTPQSAEPRLIAGGINVLSSVLGGSLVIAVWFTCFQHAPLFFAGSVDAVAGLVVAGFVTGVLLAFVGRMNPLSRELARWYKPDGPRPPRFLPGLMLALLAVPTLVPSVAAFAVVSLKYRAFASSLLKLYVAVALVYGTCWMTGLLFGVEFWAGPSAWFGSGAVFPAAMAGWAVGDFLRLPRELLR